MSDSARNSLSDMHLIIIITSSILPEINVYINGKNILPHQAPNSKPFYAMIFVNSRLFVCRHEISACVTNHHQPVAFMITLHLLSWQDRPYDMLNSTHIRFIFFFFFIRFERNSISGGFLRPLPLLVLVPARRVGLRWLGRRTAPPQRLVHRGDSQHDQHQVQHSNGGGQVGSLRSPLYNGFLISGFSSVCSERSLLPRSLAECFAKAV